MMKNRCRGVKSRLISRQRQAIRLGQSGPAGFSMIELLVVVGIILALAALLISALGQSLTSARIKATRVTITKINTILQQQRTEFEQAELKNHTYPQNKLSTDS